MKLELKGIKYAAFASEETACFEGTLYIDGKKVGTVGNEGHGGPMNFHPWELQKQLDEYGKTLPKVTATFNDTDGTPYVYEQDAESLVNELLEDFLLERDLKKFLKKDILYVNPVTKKIMGFRLKLKTPAQAVADPALVEQMKVKWNTDQILNLMTFEKAKEVYKAHT